jgi:S1-C subfamily serine protease
LSAVHADLLDLIIAVAAALAAIGGFRLGLVARAVSWIGLAAGLVVAARLLPDVIGRFADADPNGKLLVAALVLLGGAFLGQALGLFVGARANASLPAGPLRALDDAVGAAVGLVGVLVSVWLLLPSMANVPGWSSREARNSAIARFIDRDFPRPPNTVEALRRLVGSQAFPQVFNALAPAADTGPPPAVSTLSQAVTDRVAASTVKVEGDACRRIQEGSGWAVAADQIVTNAHVVAGEHRTQILTPAGRTLDATVVAFDPDRDLALLTVPGLGDQPLALASQATSVEAQEKLTGTTGAVFGHPGGQDQLAVTPFLVSEFVDALGRDLYDQRDTKRNVFVLASDLMPGDSGGPLVDPAGTVAGVAFAIAPDRPGTSYALSYTEVSAFLATAGSSAVSTGPCLND